MKNRQKICILPKLHDYLGDTGRQWFVYFSYRNASTGKMIRFKIYNGYSGTQPAEERYAKAKVVIAELTRKLKSGWNPFEDDKSVIYDDQLKYDHLAKKYGRQRIANRTMNYYMSMWFDQMRPNFGPATATTYRSKMRIFSHWITAQKLEGNDISAYDQAVAHKFIKYLFEERKVGNTTVRQYLFLYQAFFNWMKSQRPGLDNPFADIRIAKAPKTPAKYFSDVLLDRLKAIISKHNPQLWLAALFQYYCFIRPKELRFLTIGDINLDEGSITVPGKIAKNKKTQAVIIPDVFLQYMKTLEIDKYPQTFYIVTRSGMPGEIHVSKNYLYNQFVKVRRLMGLSTDYKFYSFKHTGAIRASRFITVKDLQMQLRHQSLDQVDQYLRQMKPIESESLRTKFPEI